MPSRMPISSICLSLVILIGSLNSSCSNNAVVSHTPSDYLWDLIRGKKSDSVFQARYGVNEFALCYDGDYYFIYHDFESLDSLRIKKVGDPEELQNAQEYPLNIEGKYPFIMKDGLKFHLYVFNSVTTKHYISSNPLDGWTYSDSWDGITPDPCIVKVNNNWFIAGYVDIPSGFTIHARTAMTPNGPWEERGDIFTDRPLPNWCQGGLFDPCFFWRNGHLFATFACGDNVSIQSIGVVEINPSTYKAIDAPIQLIIPEREWETAGGLTKIFNPTFIPANQKNPYDRVYYAHNPGDSFGKFREPGPYGFGYLEASVREIQP